MGKNSILIVDDDINLIKNSRRNTCRVFIQC